MRLSAGLFAVTLLAGACFAQNETPKPAAGPKAYQLDFVIKEIEDGKVVNSRNYSMMISAVQGTGAIRSGDKIPVPTRTGTEHETTYIDVGVNIDVRSVQESEGRLMCVVTADVSEPASDSARPPLIRQSRWNGYAIAPFGKSTVVFSSDDASSKRRTQLEMTATQIN